MSITTPSGGSGAPGGANMELQYDSLNHFAGTKGIRYSPSFPQLSFTGASAKGIEIVNNAGTGGLRLWSDTREGIEFSNTLEIQAAGSSDDFLTFYNVGDSLTLGFDRTYNATTWKNSKRLVSQGAFRAKIESMLAGSGTLDSLRLAFLDKANVFTDSLRIPLRAYSSAWKNSTAAPAMGDLYTKIESITGGTMTYPSGSGIPIVVSGISWGSTITNNSSNWNTAYGWGNHASVGYVTGTPWTAMGYVTGTPWTGLGYLTSLSGAVLTDQSTPQTIGATGSRLAKLWATDITVTNAITGGVTGNAGTVTVGSETADEQCFPLFGTSSTGNLSPKTNGGNFWYNSATNNLYATTFTGALAGNASSATNSTNTSNIYITSKSDNTSYSPVVVDNTGNTPTYVPATGFTMNPSTGLFTIGALKVTGGTPGAGKVLTSDATGNATWQSIESILTVRATLSAAEIQTSGSSPKVLVSAPGSGYAIEVISATLKWIAGSSAYTVGCQLGVGTGSAGVWQNYWASYGLLTNVTRIQKSLNTDGISVSNLHDNGALTVSNTSGSDPANGNGTAVVYVTYRIITL